MQHNTSEKSRLQQNSHIFDLLLLLLELIDNYLIYYQMSSSKENFEASKLNTTILEVSEISSSKNPKQVGSPCIQGFISS